MSDRQKYQLILTVTISENSKIHLGQISQVETISKVKKNFSILKIPQMFLG